MPSNRRKGAEGQRGTGLKKLSLGVACVRGKIAPAALKEQSRLTYHLLRAVRKEEQHRGLPLPMSTQKIVKEMLEKALRQSENQANTTAKRKPNAPNDAQIKPLLLEIAEKDELNGGLEIANFAASVTYAQVGGVIDDATLDELTKMMEYVLGIKKEELKRGKRVPR
jgi:hypothetical protein